MDERTERRMPSRDVLASAALAFVIAAGALGRGRFGLEWDELQLLHGAWAVGHGAVPFRDFFEHHPPLPQVLLAPWTAGLSDLTVGVLTSVRVGALAILAVVLFLYDRLIAQTGAGPVRRWAAVALVGAPISAKLFELRADWLALAALMGAMLLVLSAARGPRPVARSVASGAVCGVAIALTQKSLAPAAGVVLWIATGLRGIESGRYRRMLPGFVAGMLVPSVLVALAFAWLGALPALVSGTIGINVGWPRELDWRDVLAAATPAVNGILALAVVRLFVVASAPRTGRAVDPGESLVAAVAVAGTIAYVTTPVPWEQSMLVLVWPWAVCLAAATVAGWPDLRGFAWEREATAWLAAFAVLLAVLPREVMLHATVVWLLVGAAALVVRARGEMPGSARRAMALVVLPGVLMFARDRRDEMREDRWRAQLVFASAAGRLLPENGAALTLWDHVLPFRRAASYHWFAHAGVLDRFATGPTARPALLDDEFVRAIEGGGVGVVIADPPSLARLPRLARRLRNGCTLVRPGYAGSDLYRCGTEDDDRVW